MELIDALHQNISKNHPDRLKLRQFKVLSVQSGPPPSVTIDDRGTSIAEVRYLSSYTSPAANDVVWALVDGDADILILGKLQS